MPVRINWKIFNYILFEIVPSFFIGLLVFVGIILMFQILRLTDFAITHGLSLATLCEVIAYVVISMVPALLPMSLLFSILTSYSRLSQDSEIIAMKASGISMWGIISPSILFGLLVALASAQTSFQIAPWGNRQFEVLYSKLAHTKPAASIKSGTFSEGFFDLVVYTNKVDTESGMLNDVFIYDERDSNSPLTIIAKSGKLIPDPLFPGNSVLLRLENGDIHRRTNTHTKIHFGEYDIRLFDPIESVEREKSPQSLTLSDLNESLQSQKLPDDEKRTILTEFHKRWAIAVGCFIFALIGVALGTATNKRNQKAGGLIWCVLIIIAYWVSYVSCEGLSREGKLPALIAMWIPNFTFAIITLRLFKKNWD